MGCEEEEQEQERSTSLLNLPLLPLKSFTHTHTPSLSSPIHPTLASVPFSWEEEPGKPKPHSSSSSSFLPPFENQSNKSLDLPPRLVLLEKDARTITREQSPTTVLDGPYSMGRSRRFESPSFRMMVMGSGDCYGSFRSDIYGDMEEEELVEEDYYQQSSRPLVLAKKRRGGGYKGRFGFVGLWRKRSLKGKGEFGGGSYVFPSSVDRESECSRKEEEEDTYDGHGDLSGSLNKTKFTWIGRTGSFSSVPSPPSSKSHFWVSLTLSVFLLFGPIRAVIGTLLTLLENPS